MQQTDITTELRKAMQHIKNNITKNPRQTLDNALDLLLIKTPQDELVGFSILITYGGPTIYWNYIRGRNELIGSWGGNEERIEIESIDSAEQIMDILEELEA